MHLCFIDSSICLSACLSVRPFVSIHSCLYLRMRVSMLLFINSYICLSIYLSLHPSTYEFIHSYMFLSMPCFIHPSVVRFIAVPVSRARVHERSVHPQPRSVRPRPAVPPCRRQYSFCPTLISSLTARVSARTNEGTND